ncbi:hypothetical protein FE257_001957 [Aspergillus nanangensis]|uniref:NmrA-like domain-containing protein n=1 Tax=Aspergillus nanangensis TaxID=2582783 RepID=A0AAD4CD28_ASPNN|nr:hypothetical protein FE257_001957 [Aspergillus nanangensis]
MTLKYLITGATGGLGGPILDYFVDHCASTEYAAASSRESNRRQFEERGIAFRHIDYDSPATLETAFHEVENLLFVSSNTFDNAKRAIQHGNVVSAAKKMGVKHVWYTSLAFGGLTNDSQAAVQQAHLVTEQLLKDSGLTFTSIREGVYTEAFPLFLNWYPSTETVSLPNDDGRIAFTLRTELGEANARLMIGGGHEKEIVLLTAGEPIKLSQIVDVINEVTGRQVKFQVVSPEEFVRVSGAHDEGGKPPAFFEATVSWYESIRRGELVATDGLMRDVLGREPTKATDAVRQLLRENPNFTWHQNYVNGGP